MSWTSHDFNRLNWPLHFNRFIFCAVINYALAWFAAIYHNCSINVVYCYRRLGVNSLTMQCRIVTIIFWNISIIDIQVSIIYHIVAWRVEVDFSASWNVQRNFLIIIFWNNFIEINLCEVLVNRIFIRIFMCKYKIYFSDFGVIYGRQFICLNIKYCSEPDLSFKVIAYKWLLKFVYKLFIAYGYGCV